MVEKSSPFWLRYPARYVLPEEMQIIWGSFDVSDMHEQMVDEQYFNYVCFTRRQMRYKNKRGLDPQVKMFLDQEHIEISPAWNLPIPNEAAAYKSLAKYGKAELILTDDKIKKLNKAWEWTERHFMPYMGNSRVLSLREAVERLDMSSSSGFPFNREYVTKKELFENDPYILEWLEEDWERLAEDPMWTTIFSSSLKEELRPQEKIDENSIRTFTAGAADATVQGNRLFVDQNEKMYAAHTKSSSSIGMSPLKGNWDKLFRKLNVFKNGYAMDESQFDSSQRKFLIWGCAQLRWKMLATEFKTPENFRRIRTYYRNLINTLILTPEGIMVMKKLGMPSGCVSTVTDNTLILYTMMAFAWIDNCTSEYNSYSAFEDNTAKALVGDDNTWTVSDECHSFYNAYTVIESWKLIGITTTTDSMSPRLAEDLDFLSAHTTFIKGIAVPLYSRDKLMTSLLFAPQSHITPATSLQRCTNLLQIGWSDLVFRNFCREFIAWLLMEYDDVLKDDPRWIVAKSSIMSDEMYFTLFTNRKTMLLTQGYRETQERLIKLDNEQVMSVQTTITRTKKARQPRRGPKKGKGKTIVTKVVQNRAPARGGRNGRRRGQGRLRGERRGPRGASGIGATSFGSNKTRSITVANEEFISPVTVANQPNFNVTAYAINPGQAPTFPWLSKQAAQWEKYEFKYLEFFYKREVSEFATAGSAGKVIMSADFDASDNPPTTKQQMEDTQPHRDGMPCENISLVLPKGQMNPRGSIARYVRPGALAGNADIKTYDVGNLFVATQGIPANAEVGELRVKYVVQFSVPVLESAASAPANNQVSMFVDVNQILVSGVETTAGLATVQANGAQIPNVAGVFTPPAGNYLIDWGISYAGATNLSSALTKFDKNGVAIVGAGDSTIIAPAAVCQAIGHTGNTFVTANGTDTFRLRVNLAGTGALTSSSSLRWTLI